MEAIILKTDMHCNSCVNVVEPILIGNKSIKEYDININHPDSLITIKADGLNLRSLISKIKALGYNAELYKESKTFNFVEIKLDKIGFWKNNRNWKRASFNTINCLIGCSIGDFAMIIFLQAYYPGTSMFWQMGLAIIAGLITSVTLETFILRAREKFNWTLALKTAFSMSFISMIGMEFAMNTTDFMITGGQASFNSIIYWFALIPALIAGFILPLPYNYYKLQKHGKSCH